jgi:NAD(P)-dependent dehydrogenase (short-subunit alcohol dehydrogenase family)
LTYRASKESAEAAARRVEELGVRSLTLRADVQDVQNADRAVSAVEAAFGRLDVLVNMASVYRKSPLAGLIDDPLPAWQQNIDVDLRSSYLLSLRAATIMRKNGGGRIVNFSDWLVVGDRPRYKDYLPYYVAKSGVKGLTEVLALELAPEILVNTVAPGPVVPPPDLTREENEEVLRCTPLQRWGGPEEVARAALFLIETDFVTGETVRVDGGRHLY